MFSTTFLIKHSIPWRDYTKNELIFEQHQRPFYYFQIGSGKVKLFSLNEDGKEFIQRFFHAGESFGEPPLLGGFNYPISAAATELTRIFYIKKENFFNLLKEHHEQHLLLTQNLSRRLLHKSMLLKKLSFENPKHRILTLLQTLKKDQKNLRPSKINYTRNEIANMTGLRIETVIRTIKQLEKEKELEIRDKKIYL